MISNYSEHRPHTEIYQTKAVVSDGDVSNGMSAIFGPAIIRNFDNPIASRLVTFTKDDFSDPDASTETFTVSLTDTCLSTQASSGSWISQNMTIVPITSIADSPNFRIKAIITTTESSTPTIVDYSTGSGQSPTLSVSGDKITLSYDSTFYSTLQSVQFALDFGLYRTASQKLLVIDPYVSIENYFGPIDINNPIAFVSNLAVTAGSGKSFYADAVQLASYQVDAEGNLDLDTFATNSEGTYDCLTKVASNPNVRFFSPITFNQKVAMAGRTQVDTLSTPLRQQWRRMYIGSPWEQTLGSDASVSQIVAEVQNECKTYNDDRVILVWCDNPEYATTDNNGNIIYESLPLSYIAAALSVYRSSLLPQEPMSMRNLPWIYSAASTYTKYQQQDLNDMAMYGAFIIAQDIDNGPVYIRHQLTTDTDNGLMYYEDSVGVNFDDICYGTKDIITGESGKYNITEALILYLRNKVRVFLNSKTEIDPSVDEKIGPQLISYSNYTLYQDPNLLDRVHVSADLELPAPLNTIIVHWNGYVDVVSVTGN